jgi:hypothetical protein
MPYFIEYSTHFLKNDYEKLPARYTWKVTEKGFQDKVDIIKLTILITCNENFKNRFFIFQPKVNEKLRHALYSYAHYTR